MSATATPDQPVCEPESCDCAPCLGQYVEDEAQQVRELISLPRPNGSAFVVDRLARTTSDVRVVAHLAASEPPENASLIAEMYLADVQRRGRCRLLSAEDLASTSPASPPASDESTVLEHAPLLDGEGYCFRLRQLASSRSVPELRWVRSRLDNEQEPPAVLTLRDVLTGLEDYNPACAVTTHALNAYRHDRSCCTLTLERELQRVEGSKFVLNRGLREAVLAATQHGMTMSEIALRCGRSKRARQGTVSGETSWLARRIGLAPESGKQCPSRWVHSDVLALIAREGLGVCPVEVEL